MTGILDETYDHVSDHVHATEAQLTAMTLYAFATHGLDSFTTIGRMLFVSDQEESGKTLAMTVTVDLCANPMNADGSQPSLRSALLAASNTPETATPTMFKDEVSDVFGRSGYGGGNSNPVAGMLRRGYKCNATDSVSRNGVDEPFSIFTPFLMTGLRTAVPRDIRSRCIVIRMETGTPRKYYDVRESEAYARALSQSISQTVRSKLPELRAFRARGIHPKLTNRRLEVWESLLACAYVFGGQKWLNRAVAAFTELALDQSETTALTPRQQVIRDVAEIAVALGEPIVRSAVLADELRRIDNPLYQAVGSEHALVTLIGNSLPCKSGRVTVEGVQVRAYLMADIVAAWDDVRPAVADDVEIPDDTDDVSDLESWDDKSGAVELLDGLPNATTPLQQRIRRVRRVRRVVRKVSLAQDSGSVGSATPDHLTESPRHARTGSTQP